MDSVSAYHAARPGTRNGMFTHSSLLLTLSAGSQQNEYWPKQGKIINLRGIALPENGPLPSPHPWAKKLMGLSLVIQMEQKT